MEEIMAPQEPQQPSFSKIMKKSNVSDDFFLHIPRSFGRSHLPRDNQHDFILMGENEQEYSARYHAKQKRLCGGWKEFSVEHKLQEGDSLDFYLIEPCKFKVHIARASRSLGNHVQNGDTVEMDDLFDESTQESPASHAKRSYEVQTESDRMTCNNSKRMRLEEVPTEDRVPVNDAGANGSAELGGTDGNANSNIHDSPRDDGMSILLRACHTEHMGIAENENVLALREVPETMRPILHSESTPLEDQRVICLSAVDSNISLSNGKPTCSLNFEDVKCFEDFKIYVNGVSIDAEIPEHSRMKYYELCCSQNKFLHDDLVDNLSSNLVAAMVLEIIRIADASKSATVLMSTIHHLTGMDRTLKSFEVLGMSVGFIRARICEFVNLLNDYHTVTKSADAGLSDIERERESLHAEKAKIDELMQSVTMREALIGSLESKVGSLREQSQKKFDDMFKKAACSAW